MKHRRIFLFLLFLSLTVSAEAEFMSILSLDYSPGWTIFTDTGSEPVVRSVKSAAFGMDLRYYGLFGNGLGAGLELHGCILYKIRTTQGDITYTSSGWDGTYYQLFTALYFLYAPVRRETLLLITGAGPSYTYSFMNTDAGRSSGEGFGGVSVMADLHYLIHPLVSMNAGFRFTWDLVGYWDAVRITDFRQFQIFPFFGVGIRF
jgi:hypothetical protein